MNVEIGTEAAQCPEKEYINGIFVAVQRGLRVIALLQCPTINSATQDGMTRTKLSMERKMCPPCGPDIFNIKFLLSKVTGTVRRREGAEHINKSESSNIFGFWQRKQHKELAGPRSEIIK
jgi:hypothetical protein